MTRRDATDRLRIALRTIAVGNAEGIEREVASRALREEKTMNDRETELFNVREQLRKLSEEFESLVKEVEDIRRELDRLDDRHLWRDER